MRNKTAGKILFTALLLSALSVISFAQDQGQKTADNTFNLINPIFKFLPDKHFVEIRSFKPKIVALLDEKKKIGAVDDVAVYFRDLDNGPWFGVNERSQFAPASLVKLPLVMAWLKQAEENPALLSKKVQFFKIGSERIVKQNVLPEHDLKEGSFYTIDELLTHMIAYSNNYAYAILYLYVDKDVMQDVYTDLGYSIPGTRTPDDYINVKEYGALFRMLYNSSYLSKEMSERALNYMIKSEFSDGIMMGIPKNISVAHKFGERSFLDTGRKELHEFGIVYYPGHAYLLGVMSAGKDFSTLKQTMKEVSSLIYNEFDKQLKDKQ